MGGVLLLGAHAFIPGLAARESGAPASSEDFADIYIDRYFGPDERLKLDDAGRRRAEALAHFSRGLSLEASRRIPEAVAAYRKVLEISPGEVTLARKVAYLLAKSGDRQGGRSVLEEAGRANLKSPQSGIFLSEYLATFFAGDPAARAEALRLAEKAVEKFPAKAASWEHLANLHLAAREPGKARAVLVLAMESDVKGPLFWLRIGAMAQRIWPLNPDEQSPALINEAFEKALALGADNPRVRERAGDYYHDSGQPERALAIFNDLVRDYSDLLGIRQKLARVYGALGREDDVIATLKDIIEINPQDADTHRELGRIYQGREDYENASSHFREAMRLTSGTAEEYETIGRMIITGTKMAEDAVPFLERGAYLHPENPRLPFLLTFALSRLDRDTDAVAWFEKTVKLATQSQPELLDAVFYYRYAAAVERAGDIDRASNLFRASIEQLAKLDKDDERSQSLRAEIYNYLGYMWLENDRDIDEAGELIKEALVIKPESGAYIDSLGWYYFKKGKYEDARRELLKAQELTAEPDATIHDHLGQTFFHLGDKNRALELMRKAVELDPDSAEFKERLREFETSTPPVPKAEETPAVEPKPEAKTPSKKAA